MRGGRAGAEEVVVVGEAGEDICLKQHRGMRECLEIRVGR